MNIYLSITLMCCAVSSYAWEFADFIPTALFSKQESNATHEFFKVTAPVSCIITQQHGPVKITGWDKDSIAIEVVQKGSKDALDNTLVTLDKSKLPHELSCTVSRKNDDRSSAHVTLHAKVPSNCNVTVRSQKGPIKTKYLSRTQSLYADDGAIDVVLTKFSSESSLFVHNKRGMITIELPKKIQAQLTASTLRGSITSELFITLQPQTTLLDKAYWHRVKKEVNGFLGDGGAPITLEAEYGDIKLIAKK